MAYAGTIPISGAKNKASINRSAVITEAKPVLAPFAIPAADSI